MVGRPVLPLGTWGEIRVAPSRNGKGHRAFARYRDFDGRTRQVEVTAPSPAAAKRGLREKLASRAAPSNATGVTLTKDSRFRDLAQAYFSTDATVDAGVSEQTLDQYVENWKRYTEPAMGDLLIREVTSAAVMAFLSTLDDRPATKATVRSQLMGMCSAGVRRDLFAANPVAAVRPPIVKRRKARALTLLEVDRLRKAVASHDRKRRNGEPYLLDVLDVALGTGLRISEIVPVAWDDIDFAARKIHIRRHVIRKKGSVTGLAPSRKGTDDDFIITAPAFVISTLLVRRARVPESEWVFQSIRTKRHMSTGAVIKQLGYARGEEFEWVTSHVFRKTVATLLDAQRDVEAAAGQLGHAHSSTTRLHYVQKNLEAPDLSDILALLAPT